MIIKIFLYMMFSFKSNNFRQNIFYITFVRYLIYIVKQNTLYKSRFKYIYNQIF